MMPIWWGFISNPDLGVLRALIRWWGKAYSSFQLAFPFSNIKWWWIKLTKPHETPFLGHQRTVCCPPYGTGVLDPQFSKPAIFGGKLSHREWWHRQFVMGNSDDGKEQLTSKISIFRHPGLDLLPQILGHMDLILVLRSTLKHQRRTWKTFQKAEITWIER